jgi:hypothetical protein
MQYLLISPKGTAYGPKGIIKHYDSQEQAEAARDTVEGCSDYTVEEA